MPAQNPWNGTIIPDSPSSPDVKGSSSSVPFNREKIKTALRYGGGAAALALIAGLGIAHSDDIGKTARRARALARNAVHMVDTPDLTQESATDRSSQAAALVNEDMTETNRFEVQLATYRINHSATYRSDAAYQQLLDERRTRATHILETATQILRKDSSQPWGAFIENAWNDPETAALFSSGLLYSISIALHRSSREIGDANDQEAARVAYQLFSRPGWQTDDNLGNLTDDAGLHYGILTNLEREGITSFHVGHRLSPRGNYELTADRAFYTAMVARVSAIHRVIEEKRTAGHLTLADVRAALEATPDTSVALANVPVEVTLAAVWGRLILPGAVIDNEVIRTAILGGRPITTVLRERDTVGGGLVKANEKVPSEVPDPRGFVVVR